MKKIDISTPKHPNTFTLVDDEDYEWLNQWKWRAKKGYSTFYVIRSVKGRPRTLRMHRLIMEAPSDMEVDHINHNGLDNQRSNLRLCTHNQQQYNRLPTKNVSSKYKGVLWHKKGQKREAKINYKGERIHLGLFTREKDAAEIYQKASKKYFGDFHLKGE